MLGRIGGSIYVWHGLFTAFPGLHDSETGAAFQGAAPDAMLPISSRKDRAPIAVENLRHPSLRPSVVVDPAAFGIVAPDSSLVGCPAPLGRERVLFALPLEPGPSLLSPPTVLRDPGSAYVADPQGALIGTPAVWVSRMQTARWVEDTRRLAG
jgi:hypothetical protein